MIRYTDLRGVERFMSRLTTTGWLSVVLGVSLMMVGWAMIFWPQLALVAVSSVTITIGLLITMAGIETLSVKRLYRRWKQRLLG